MSHDKKALDGGNDSGPGAGRCLAKPAAAQGRAQAARAAAEFLIERFGPQACAAGGGGVMRRIETMALRHGEEVFVALKKVGPRFFEIVEAAARTAPRPCA